MLWLQILIVLMVHQTILAQTESEEEELEALNQCRELFREKIYDNTGILSLPNTKPHNVSFNWKIGGVSNIDESWRVDPNMLRYDGAGRVAGKVTVSFFLSMRWFDKSLRWNTTTECRNKYISVYPVTRMWFPYFVIANSYNSRYNQHRFHDVPALVVYNGKVIMDYFVEEEVKCDMNMKNYPNDKHTCDVQIWFSDQVSLQPREKQFSGYETTINANWDFVKYEMVTKQGGMDSVLDRLLFQVTIRRKPEFTILTMILPTMILCPLPILPFALPHDSGEKMGVTLTALLAYFVMSLGFFAGIPASSFFPQLGVWFLYLMGTTGLATFLAAAVLRFARIEEQKQICSCGASRDTREEERQQMTGLLQSNLSGDIRKREKSRISISHVLNNLGLVIFTVTNFIFPMFGLLFLLLVG